MSNVYRAAARVAPNRHPTWHRLQSVRLRSSPAPHLAIPHLSERDPLQLPSTKPFRIRTSTKSNSPLCKSNSINAISPNYADAHELHPSKPSIYNTYKTHLP